eukprot:CAMPEP_0176446652 /NCGR_PEP_ID=MMETSP0127-20121128/24457_1 /TAXON_ID=938130 /ORGANISM="Platyophrya macrostoma, Strain WH" /LENGTH=213 /DNA_ID=CAMNT_0017832735 /DNA_START=104 /DNA_END=745 /DNA_ORIENTATION=-
MVVLGGPGIEKVEDEFKVSGDLKERLDQAVKIFKKNEIKDNYIAFIVSGGLNIEGCPAESTLMKNYLMDRHFISESDIIEEPLSLTIVENALCIRDHILKQYFPDYADTNKVLHITTSTYNVVRAQRIFEFAFKSDIVSGLVSIELHGAPIADESKPEKIKFVKRQDLMTLSDEIQRKEMIEIAEWQTLNADRIQKRLGSFYSKDKHQKLFQQ